MFDLRTDVWLQEVSALTGQGEGKTNSSDVWDWCCDWVSLGHDPLRGQMLKAKSLHDGCWEMFSSQSGRGRFTDPVTGVVCFKSYIKTSMLAVSFYQKWLYFSGFNDSQPQSSHRSCFVLNIFLTH